MKQCGSISLLLLGVIAMVVASPSLKQEIQERLLGTSVQVIASKESAWGEWVVMGSGVVFKKNGKSYVVTAAHVVEDLKQVISDIDEGEGKEKKKILWRDAWILIERIKEGRKTGELRLLAKVKFATKTEEEGGDDVAVLEVYEGDLLPYSAVPLPRGEKVWVGQECWHVGSLYGAFVNSVSKGIIASVGRLIHDKPFHQTSTTAAPGSSGGGVFVVGDDGHLYYAGMLTRGTGQTINFVVPIERMREALKDAPEEIRDLLD